MKIGHIDLNKDLLIVAEIGNNHEGSYSVAEELIRLAAVAGANAVKFQTFRTEFYVSRKDQARFNRLKSFELTYDEFERLSKVAKQEGLIFLSTPFDLKSARFLDAVVPAFKIASGDNNFYPLLETVATFGKPIILSAGCASLAQIQYSKSFIERIWEGASLEQELAVLHCVSQYPVTPSDACLSAIPSLREKLRCTIGYSDHTIGIEAAALSVALGARIIEKHFTINKNYSDFRDHQLSSDPTEFAALVKKVNTILTLLGPDKTHMLEGQQSTIKALRRSIVASRDLPKGEVLLWDDITWIRPQEALPPGKENLIMGRTLLRPVERGTPISTDMLRNGN